MHNPLITSPSHSHILVMFMCHLLVHVLVLPPHKIEPTCLSQAMYNSVDTLLHNGTCKLFMPPHLSQNVIKYKWVFQIEGHLN